MSRFRGYLFCLCFGGCTTHSSDELLGGSFITQGQKSITLISPANNAIESSGNPTLVWTAVTGVANYHLQIAADSGFKTLILDKTVSNNNYTIQNSDLISGTALESATYYWRVKVPVVSNNLLSPTFTFHFLTTNANGGATLYVNAASTASAQTGTKTTPYKTINLAVKAADVLRQGNISTPMQVLVAQGTYSEFVQLYAGISIYGGYEANGWTRNVSANTTTLKPVTDIALQASADVTTSYTSTTVVDGFTLSYGTIANVTGTNGFVQLNSASPTIINNTFVLHPSLVSTGLFFSNVSPVITGNSFTSTYNQGYGIYCNVSNGSFSITQNTFTGSAISAIAFFATCGGTFARNSVNVTFAYGGVVAANSATQPVYINANQILISNMWSDGRGIYIDNGSTATITNNIVSVTSSAAFAVHPVTAFSTCNSTPTATNNTFTSGTTGANTTGVYTQCGTTGVITNNIIITTSSGGTQTCYSGTLTNLQNNFTIGCTGTAGTNTSITFAAADFVGGTTFSLGMDFRLKSTSLVGLKTGGRDASTSVCGASSNLSCGNVTTDRDNVTRTAPFSIGAYEMDL